MALPDNISYATVKGRFVLAVADSTDDDSDPDAQPAQGQIHFIPNVTSLLNVTSDPPTVVIPRRITVDLDAEGYIALRGLREIKLLATDNTSLNPVEWTYTIQYAIVGVELPRISVQLPGGSVTDITSMVAVTATSGVPTVIGPQGPQGPQGEPGTGDGSPSDIEDVIGLQAALDARITNPGPAATARVVTVGTDGVASVLTHSQSAVADTVAVRTTSGRLTVGTPTGSGDATTKTYVDTAVATRAASSHNHAASDINSGTVAMARLPVAADGVSSSTALVRADDSRLTGGGGGTGTVTEVNGVEPVDGVITLTPTNIGAAAASHAHDAGDISTGTLAEARVPTLPQSKITNLVTDLAGKANTTHSHSAAEVTSGTLATARIPNLDTAKITTGVFDVARLPAHVVTVNDQTGDVDVSPESIEAVRNLTPGDLGGFGVGTELPTAGGGKRLFFLIPE